MSDWNRLGIIAGTIFMVLVSSALPVHAEGHPLKLSTQTRVSESGQVVIDLSIQNTSSRRIHHIHPMFHFHHTLSHMKMLHRLDPGKSVTLANADHPPVVRVGSYPVVVMVNYKSRPDSESTSTQVHTDSFYFQEKLLPAIQGSVETVAHENTSTLKFYLKNTSSAFKNVRLMLLLPPELHAEEFNSMMGFTIRGGEEKRFEVPIKKIIGQPAGTYPVHLLVEYGEMLKHYSGDIAGQAYFGASWNQGPFWPQMLVFAFIFTMLSLAVYRRRNHRLKTHQLPAA